MVAIALQFFRLAGLVNVPCGARGGSRKDVSLALAAGILRAPGKQGERHYESEASPLH